MVVKRPTQIYEAPDIVDAADLVEEWREHFPKFTLILHAVVDPLIAGTVLSELKYEAPDSSIAGLPPHAALTYEQAERFHVYAAIRRVRPVTAITTFAHKRRALYSIEVVELSDLIVNGRNVEPVAIGDQVLRRFLEAFGDGSDLEEDDE